MLIPENKHETKIKSFEKDLVDTKLTASIDAEMAALQKPYSEQMRAWAISAKVFGGLGLGFSFITEAGVIGWVAYGMVEGVTGQAIGVAVGVVVGAGVAGVIEWVKKHSNDNFWRVLVFGKRFEVARFVPVLLIGGVSLAASIYACTLLPAAKGKVSGELVFDQSKVDAVAANFDKKIAEVQASTAFIKENGKKSNGQLRDSSVNIISSNEAYKKELERAKDAAIADEKAAENARIAQTETEHETQGYFLAWASFFLELLFVTSSYFGMRYLHKCYLERNAKRNDNETLSLPLRNDNETISLPLRNIQLPDIAAVTPAVTADNETPNETGNASDNAPRPTSEGIIDNAQQRQPIGFKRYITADDTAAVTPAVTQKENYLLRVKEAKEKGLGITIGGIYMCDRLECTRTFELNTFNRKFCSEHCKLAARANKQQEAATNEK
jgi:hypothetical protein